MNATNLLKGRVRKPRKTRNKAIKGANIAKILPVVPGSM
jgi:hypothetical protein